MLHVFSARLSHSEDQDMLSDRPFHQFFKPAARLLPRLRRVVRGSLLSGLSLVGVLAIQTGAIGQTVSAANAPATTTPSRFAQVAPARPILQLGSEGQTVAELQAMLRLMGYYTGPVDGFYEDGTATAVAVFQQSAGLQADGIVGPMTWNRLLPSATTAATPPPQPEPVAQQPAPAPTAPQAPGSFPSPTPTTPPAATTPAPPSPAPTNPPEVTPDPQPQAEQADPEPETAYINMPILRYGMEGPAVERLQERMRSLGFYDGVVDGVFGPQTEAAVQALQRNFEIEADGIVGPVTWTVLLR
jgi:peptidoglycan hydrolase-like protein with peptidoglycan-binding domain